jgi:hypothetical protein
MRSRTESEMFVKIGREIICIGAVATYSLISNGEN